MPVSCPEGYTLTGSGGSPVVIPYTVRSAASDDGMGGYPLTVQDILSADGAGALPPPYVNIGMPDGAVVQVADLLATTADLIAVISGGVLQFIRADEFYYISFPEAIDYVGSTVVFSGDLMLQLNGPGFTAMSETYTFDVTIPAGGGSYCAPDDVVPPEPVPNPRTITLRTQELRFYNSYALIPPGETVLPPQTGGPTPV